MPILIDYQCGACGVRAEQWAQPPVAPRSVCAACGAVAYRCFGAVGLLTGAERSPTRPPSTRGHSCAEHMGVPGSCTLTPTASRMLAARVSGDQRAVDRELAHQEQAIAAGTLDPKSPVTTASPAHQNTRSTSEEGTE